MNTQIISGELDAAAELLRQGELVAVPTETVYGLAGNGLDEQAVHNIYEVKGRPERKPLSLMVPDAGAIALYCEDVPEQAYTLAEHFWPGPLTIILKAKDSVPEIVRAGGETVGLRCPDHPLTLELLKKAQIPFAAPSANPSGEPSPKTAEEVKGYFNGKIAAIVDGGPCGLGKESTLLLMTTKPYRVLRQGALPAEEIAAALAEKMTILGITGGSGGGKTTALREIERKGGLVLDCDAVYHELLAENRELLGELDARFPGCVTEGALDRKALGRIVFSDAEALKELNAITHRYVGAEVEKRLRDWAMAGGTLAAVDAIELIASGLGERCDLTVAVLAEKEKRVQRIMARDGIGREAALARIEAQRPDGYFINNCDCVLYNNGDEAAFTQAFQRLIKEKEIHV